MYRVFIHVTKFGIFDEVRCIHRHTGEQFRSFSGWNEVYRRYVRACMCVFQIVFEWTYVYNCVYSCSSCLPACLPSFPPSFLPSMPLLVLFSFSSSLIFTIFPSFLFKYRNYPYWNKVPVRRNRSSILVKKRAVKICASILESRATCGK